MGPCVSPAHPGRPGWWTVAGAPHCSWAAGEGLVCQAAVAGLVAFSHVLIPSPVFKLVFWSESALGALSSDFSRCGAPPPAFPVSVSGSSIRSPRRRRESRGQNGRARSLTRLCLAHRQILLALSSERVWTLAPSQHLRHRGLPSAAGTSAMVAPLDPADSQRGHVKSRPRSRAPFAHSPARSPGSRWVNSKVSVQWPEDPHDLAPCCPPAHSPCSPSRRSLRPPSPSPPRSPWLAFPFAWKAHPQTPV